MVGVKVSSAKTKSRGGCAEEAGTTDRRRAAASSCMIVSGRDVLGQGRERRESIGVGGKLWTMQSYGRRRSMAR